MPQTHHLPRKLDTGHKKHSRVYWSVDLPDTLVLFVHGFGGGPEATWPLFPDLLPQVPDAGRLDIVLYGYDGVGAQSGTSASLLRGFLERFLADPGATMQQTVGSRDRPVGFRYARILIVAHSLGSVVARRALLEAARLAATDPGIRAWLDTVRLVLFAPAHCGANAPALALELLTGLPWALGRLAPPVAKFFSPLLAELSPGSDVLQKLEQDTRTELQKRPGAPYLVARQVVWAGRERIVRNTTFVDDPPARTLAPWDHTQVCKPLTLRDERFVPVRQEI